MPLPNTNGSLYAPQNWLYLSSNQTRTERERERSVETKRREGWDMYYIFSSRNSFDFIFRKFFCSIRVECPSHPIIIELITLYNVLRAYVRVFGLLRPNMYFLSIFLPYVVSLGSSFGVWGQVSRTYKIA
jgi:hypothetical protein